MDVLAFLMLGFAPGVFWLWLIYQRDKYIPAPVHLVVRTFLWGIAVSLPVVIAEALLTKIGGFQLDGQTKLGLREAAYGAFVVAGMTEELAKYLVVKKTVYNSPYFRQPLDGIMFSAAAALGFASIENVGYMAAFGPAVILTRGPFSTLAHVLFSVMFGYALGVRRLGKLWPHAPLVSLLAAMALHGLFDFLFLAGPVYAPWALVLFFAMGVLFFVLLRLAQRQSPFRGKVTSVLVTCSNCMQRSGYGSGFCTACGQSLTTAKASDLFLCGNCNSQVESHHHFCTSCGGRLNRKLVSVGAS